MLKMKTNFIIILILIVFLTSCVKDFKKVNMFEIFKKDDPIINFWNWFKENESRLRDIEKKPNEILSEILTNASQIENELAFETLQSKNGEISLIISADGVKELFPTVTEIIEKSPKIKGWKFIAFRQRMTKEKLKNITLKANNYEVDPSKMKFFPIESKDNLDIIIYIEGVTEKNYNQVTYSGLMLIDNLIGEYDCVTKVRNYDFHEMPTRKKDLEELKPLLEFPDYIDEYYIKKKEKR